MRAASDKVRYIDACWLKEKVKPTDMRRAYLEEAALHMVNEASIQNIKQILNLKYAGHPPNIDFDC